MESNKGYQLSIKKANEAGLYDVYLGDLKLDFQVGPNPAFPVKSDVPEDESLHVAARFIVKLARSFAQSRKNMQKKEDGVVTHG